MPTRRSKRKAADTARKRISADTASEAPAETQEKAEVEDNKDEDTDPVSEDEDKLHGPCNCDPIGADPDPRFVYCFFVFIGINPLIFSLSGCV